MKLNKLTTAVVALAAVAALGSSARAATPTYTSGDLILGFEEAGQANDYVADIGSASNFIGATAPLTLDISQANLAADFGSSWNANPTSGEANLLEWGVVGNDQGAVVQSNTKTVFYTEAEQTAGTLSTPPASSSVSALGQVANDIKALQTATTGGFATYQVQSGAGEAVGVSESSSAANSWTSFAPSRGTGFNLSTGVEQPGTGANDGPTDSFLDLYEVSPGSQGTLLGTLSLSWDGNTSDDAVLTFDPAAVPEPSTYALGLTALILFGVLKRRQSIGKA